MARTTGVDILNIRPDSSMGFAQDSNIPVVATELDQVNKATASIRDYDHQRQLMKYEHQLKQRDNLIKGISEGEISTKQILPEDRDAFKESENKVRKAFLAVTSSEPDAKGQNVLLDQYHQAQQDHKDLTTMLQSRYVEVGKKRQARAETNLPSEQKALDVDIDKAIKQDKMEPVRPFQKPFTRDFDEIISTGLNGALVTPDGQPVNSERVTTKTTKGSKGTTVQTTTTPTKEITGKSGKTIPITEGIPDDGKIPEIITEPDVMLSDAKVYRNIENRYNNPKEEAFRVNVERTWEDYQGTNDQTLQNHILLADSRLAQKDQEFGIPTIKHYPDKFNRSGPPNPDNPNDPVGKVEDTGHYPSQINHRMVGDKMIIEETPVSLAAKLATAFAPVENYVVKGKKYLDKDAVKLNMDEKELDEKIRDNRAKEANEWYDSRTRRISATKPNGTIIPTGIEGNALNGIPLIQGHKDGVFNLMSGGKKYLGQLQQVLGDKILPDYLLQSDKEKDAISIVVKNGAVQAIEIGGKIYDRQEIDNLQKSRDKEAKGAEHQKYPLEQSYLSNTPAEPPKKQYTVPKGFVLFTAADGKDYFVNEKQSKVILAK